MDNISINSLENLTNFGNNNMDVFKELSKNDDDENYLFDNRIDDFGT